MTTSRASGGHLPLERNQNPTDIRHRGAFLNWMRRFIRILPLAVLVIALPASANKASKAYKAGEQAEARDNTDGAYQEYKTAYSLSPKDPRYMAAYTRLRFKAASEHVHKGEVLLDEGNLAGALGEFMRASEIDSSNTIAEQEARRVQAMMNKAATEGPEEPEEPLAAAAAKAEGPVVLHPLSTSPITLRITENTKFIYKTICSLVGINVLFDPEYTPRKISIELDGVNLNDALEMVALSSKTFWRPVTPNTIYVTSDTPGKRKEMEQSVIKTFYLTNVSTPTDLADAANSIRSILDITRVQQVQSQNALIVRATPDQLVLAEKLLSDIDKAKAEVMIDVAILEVTRDRLRTLGTNPPTSFNASIAPSGGTSGGSGNLTLNSLPNLTANDIAVAIPGAAFTALMSDSNTKIIQNPQVRVLDNQQATLKIGERVPIATGSFSPGVGGVGVSPLVNTQFQYLDVGVNISITPRIHSWRDTTLKIVVEVSSVTGQQNIGGVTQPIIGQRRIEHETRLREGEVNLLGGILEDSESDSLSGLPLLAKIPFLRYFFAQNEKTRTQREIVFAITPHIVRAQEITPQNLREIDVGSPNEIELRYPTATPESKPASGEKLSTAPANNPRPQPQPARPAPLMTSPSVPVQSQPPAVRLPEVGNQVPAPPAVDHAGVEPANNLSLSFDPTTVTEKVGSRFTVNIDISGAKDVFSVPLQLRYDPKQLDILDVGNAGFLGPDGQPVAVVFRTNPEKGMLQINASRPPNTGGVSGAGAVFSITMLAKAPGESILDIASPSVLDHTMQEMKAQGGDLLITVVDDSKKDLKSSPQMTNPDPRIERSSRQPVGNGIEKAGSAAELH